MLWEFEYIHAMPTMDFLFDVDFSATVSLSGTKAEGAGLYVGGMLMDAVKLDPDAKLQDIPFWEGKPIHGGLLGGTEVYVRVFSTTSDWTKHALTFTQACETVRPSGGQAYVMAVRARSYDTEPRDCCLCYTPEGMVGYLPPDIVRDDGFTQ